MRIEVWVNGTPKPQPRPKAFAIGGHARVYDPKTAEGFKSEIAIALRPWARLLLEGPVTVRIDCYFRRPASHFKKNGGLTSSAPTFPGHGAGDWDNLGKAVCDCATAIGIWRDDAQVIDGRVTKQYDAERQGCTITIEAVDVVDKPRRASGPVAEQPALALPLVPPAEQLDADPPEPPEPLREVTAI